MNQHLVGFECELDDANGRQIRENLIRMGWWAPPDDDHRAVVRDDYNDHCGDRDCEYCNDEYGHPDDDDDDYIDCDGLHANHCCCSSCQIGASLFKPQYDGSCAAEIVSDPLPWPDPQTEAIIQRFCNEAIGAWGLPGPSAGFHIHVEYPTDHTDDTRQKIVDYFCLYELEFAEYARQQYDVVRRYNQWLRDDRRHQQRYATSSLARPSRSESEPLSPHRLPYHKTRHANKGMNLALRPETWEFRIWNSTIDSWRMHMALSVTCAFVDAALEAPDIDELDPSMPAPTMFDFIAPHLDDTSLAYVTRHLHTDPVPLPINRW